MANFQGFYQKISYTQARKIVLTDPIQWQNDDLMAFGIPLPQKACFQDTNPGSFYLTERYWGIR